jgi:hypothetical protein
MIKKFISPIALSLILISCTEATITDPDSSEIVEIEDEAIIEEEEDDMAIYAKDWEKFKTAVANNDMKGVSAFASSDEVDAETLLMVLSVEPYISALAGTKFEDMKVNNLDEGRAFEFYAEETGVDDEGNEVGSSVTIYFTLGDNGLELDYFIAAG